MQTLELPIKLIDVPVVHKTITPFCIRTITTMSISDTLGLFIVEVSDENTQLIKDIAFYLFANNKETALAIAKDSRAKSILASQRR